MKRKNFQIKIDPKAHAQLKFRAKQLNITIGEYLENLISAMEVRLQKAYSIMGVQDGLIDTALLKILLKDDLSINKIELSDELKKSSSSMDTLFVPKITV